MIEMILIEVIFVGGHYLGQLIDILLDSLSEIVLLEDRVFVGRVDKL